MERPTEIVTHAEILAECYGVSVEWLTGEAREYDYETVKAMEGSEELSFHDRDVIAEFAASLPKRKQG